MGAVAKLKPETNARADFAARITDGYKRIYRDVLAIGAMLVEARKALPHGEFLRMLETDLPFSQRTAYNYIREWTIANSENLQPVATLTPAYSVRAEIDRLTDEEIQRGLGEGKLYQGVPRSEVIDFRKSLRTEHQHRPAAREVPAPSRPKGNGAVCYSELVHLLIEWRNVRGLSQLALDQRVGWGEGMTSKLEIPHMDDGRTASHDTLRDWMQGLRVCLQVVPTAVD